ncbi:uncharacterized protein BCR38DRAFT_481711 [Pseudomassariella vexata]|uniref:Uncharacterized protein n=1 Tax=Pseudomassariella vexata TaxID=1141098 RepID=A0A1Y2EAE4_9PEZI|nr:uncharacterized protein BCR38DRAFT_481711 [Pseudomassariella vexata]ORY68226.1 hypothetical protein BCR38DRAFT_481711 [Pseudomassariella vexata]
MKFITLVTATAMASIAQASMMLLPAEFNSIIGIERRQASGASYECHADCGYTIIGARTDGYCDNSTWTDLLDDCLDCALVYDIWKDYGDSVTAAAKGCGLDATPKAANSTATASSGSTTVPSTSTSSPTTTESSAPSGTQSGATTSTTEPSSASGRFLKECLALLTVAMLGWGLSWM